MSLLRTPFHQRHVDAGARMVPFAGFEMPVQYVGIRQEHLAVRSACGLFDVSHMGEIRVRGPKAQAALQHLLSNGVLRVAVGQAQYNILCNHRGGVVDDVFLYRLADEDFLVCVNAANRAKDAAWFAEHNPYPEGAHITDEGDAWAQLAVQGPAAVRVMSTLTEEDCEGLARRHHMWGSFAGVDGCIIARTGYTGEDGFEVFIPSDVAAPTWDRVMDAGRAHGLQPIGLGARDTLRLEAGNCLYGHELDDETSPIQAGLGWVVKTRKPGGFIGSEAIDARRDTDRRVLVGLRACSKRIPRQGMDVCAGGAVVGSVTSGTRGPSVEVGIAMAMVDREYMAVGTQLDVDVRGKPAPFEVVSLPFVSRSE